MPEPETAPAPYEAPKLTSYGRLEIDTAGFNPGSQFDGIFQTYSQY
jgi:hypothetical protein